MQQTRIVGPGVNALALLPAPAIVSLLLLLGCANATLGDPVDSAEVCEPQCSTGINAETVCVDGHCVEECVDGWHDLDGETGCEYRCTSAGIETCNGLDDDCDGVCDTECCLGTSETCTSTCGTEGVRACLDGCAWSTCVPPPESCNGVDDDCDAVVDNGAGCIVRVHTNTATPCGLYLCTYDDFRFGPDETCIQLGYAGTTGAFSCVAQICSSDDGNGSCLDWTPDTCYRSNGSWGTADQCPGEGYCPGAQYVEWVDCVIP